MYTLTTETVGDTKKNLKHLVGKKNTMFTFISVSSCQQHCLLCQRVAAQMALEGGVITSPHNTATWVRRNVWLFACSEFGQNVYFFNRKFFFNPKSLGIRYSCKQCWQVSFSWCRPPQMLEKNFFQPFSGGEALLSGSDTAVESHSWMIRRGIFVFHVFIIFHLIWKWTKIYATGVYSTHQNKTKNFFHIISTTSKTTVNNKLWYSSIPRSDSLRQNSMFLPAYVVFCRSQDVKGEHFVVNCRSRERRG